MMKKRNTPIFELSLVSLSFLALGGCGFTPVHQSQGSFAGQSYANLRIEALSGENPDDKEAGFDIKQSMIDRIGQGSGEHILEISPRLNQRRLGISGDDIASRFEISLQADYKLIEDKTGDILDKGRLSSKTSFGAPADPFGRIAAEEDAAKRIASDIADDLVIVLSKYYAKTGS